MLQNDCSSDQCELAEIPRLTRRQPALQAANKSVSRPTGKRQVGGFRDLCYRMTALATSAS